MDDDAQLDARPADQARRRARDLFRRTAPVLRDVNAAIEQNRALRETRDALVQKADEALGRITAIEGTVVERDAAGTEPIAAEPSTTPGDPAAPSEAGTPPAREREAHWTRQRVARMVTAAATEAVRPHRPLITRRARLSLTAAASAVVAVLLLRRLRR